MPSPIGILSKAIMRRWAAIDGSDTFTGNLWNDEIPRDKKLPYVVFAITDGGSIEGRTSGADGYRKRIQVTQVQFDVYERGRSAAGALADKLMTYYDDQPLDCKTNEMDVLGVRYFNDYCVKEDETVFRWTVTFEIRYWINERVNNVTLM